MMNTERETTERLLILSKHAFKALSFHHLQPFRKTLASGKLLRKLLSRHGVFNPWGSLPYPYVAISPCLYKVSTGTLSYTKPSPGHKGFAVERATVN